MDGIWGGLSGKERHRRRRDQRAAENRSIDESAYISLDEYSRVVGIHPTTALKRVRAGMIPGAQQIGRRWMIPSVEVHDVHRSAVSVTVAEWNDVGGFG